MPLAVGTVLVDVAAIALLSHTPKSAHISTQIRVAAKVFNAKVHERADSGG